MSALPEEQRPKSDDPDFWAVWSGQDEHGKPVVRKANWKQVADDWQQISSSTMGVVDSCEDDSDG